MDGLRESATDQRGTTFYTYDARRQLTRVDHPNGEFIAYVYDPAGNIASTQSPGGTASYTYDALNRLESVTDPDLGLTVYNYDAAGNREGATLPNGTTTDLVYDPLNRLTNIEHRGSDLTVFSRFQYSLDNAGNRLTVQDQTGRLTTYGYDALHRLTREEGVGGLLANRTLDHAYDAVGNRILETTDGFPVASSYDANDRLLTQGAVSYSYDVDGNTLQKTGPSGTTDYTYDELNRLKTINGPSTTSSYAYDQDGQRTQSIENGTTTHYLIDGNRRFAQVLEERDGSNILQAHYTWGLGLIRQQRGATTSYYHHDGHGSVRALTDAAEAITDTYDYDAYGGLLDQTGTTENSYRYAGEQFVSGLGGYYLRARYYQPGAGRFLTRDDFAGFERSPVSLNKYLYANANPVMGVDPSGRFTLGSQIATVAGIGVLAAITITAYQNIVLIPTQGIDLPNFPTIDFPTGPPGLRALEGLLGILLASEAEQLAEKGFREHGEEIQEAGFETQGELEIYVEDVLAGATGAIERALDRGREAYWDPDVGLIIIRDPSNVKDGGTVMGDRTGGEFWKLR